MSKGTLDFKNMTMLDLFRVELENQCVTLNHEIHELEKTPSATLPLEEINRAVHAIKGAARIVDLEIISQLTVELEAVLNAHDGSFFATGKGNEVLHDILLYLSRLSKNGEENFDQFLLDHDQQVRGFIRNLQELQSIAPRQRSRQQADSRQSTQKYVSTTQSDEDQVNTPLIDIFREDAQQQLAVITDSLLNLENNSESPHFFEVAMRATHSMKGAARVVDLDQVVKLTHAMEDVFVLAQEKKLILAQEHVDVLFEAVDFLKELLKTDDKLISDWLDANSLRFDMILTSIMAIGQADEQNLAASQLSGSTEDDPKTQSVDRLGSQTMTDGQQAASDNRQERSLRVSAESMSRLMGLASEALIESRWLPSLVYKSLQLKRFQDNFFQSYNLLRRELIHEKLSPKIQFAFSEIINNYNICRTNMADFISEIEDHTRKATEISHRLHREVIVNRMQPFAEGIKGFPRLIRDLSKKLNKKIRFEVSGAETLVDRDIMEKLEAPLTHLLVNSIDHGIEDQQERIKTGKKETGVIHLSAKHASGMLLITLTDDGRGIDLEKLRSTIIDKKLVSDKIARELTDNELIEFLFLPNFSTRDEVSEVSGRGVGLDVVHNTIRETRGTVRAQSKPGHGLSFEIQLPLTLSIIRSLYIEISNEPYALPLVNIDHIVKLPATEIKEIEGKQYFIANGKRIGLMTAQQVLDIEEQLENKAEYPVIIFHGNESQYGMIVDRLIGIRDLVVQPLNPRLGKLRSVSAAAISEDGTPIIILDVKDLLNSIDHLISGDKIKPIESFAEKDRHQRIRNILVVDDSITVREVERKMLIGRGYGVDVAGDGLEAWNMVKNKAFDLIITDVDMPIMDGIELISQLKSAAEYEDIPIIIVSYKDREEDRERGLDAGADYYLTKGSFQDETLLEAVRDLIGDAILQTEIA